MSDATLPTHVRLQQPDWLLDWCQQHPAPHQGNAEDCLRDVLALAQAHLDHGSGGPFAAIVYDRATNQRLACAVNTVIANQCAVAHAELQALALAQQALRHYRLPGSTRLVSTGAPCTMCLGAIVWSGVSELVYASPREDIEAIGFDEGPATPDWHAALEQRGIHVQGPLLREEGRAILLRYHHHAGLIYNGQ